MFVFRALFFLLSFFLSFIGGVNKQNEYGTTRLNNTARRKAQTFAEVLQDSMRRLEEKRIKTAEVEEDGGATPGLPHPIGWVGT